MSSLLKLMLILFTVGIIGSAVFVFWYRQDSGSNSYIRDWFTSPIMRSALITEGGAACEGAPFIMPSEGFIGLFWSDPARPYNPLRRHTGIDIFGDGDVGTVPNYAAYDGYLTRLSDWKSTVIIRHDDPLQAGHTIWTYYTHMANDDGSQSFIVDDFPAGTHNQWVEQGALLGYQGTYSGVGPPIGMHLHFSVVQSDSDDVFLNEAILDNTLDPSPYFGLSLNINDNPERPVRCP